MERVANVWKSSLFAEKKEPKAVECSSTLRKAATLMENMYLMSENLYIKNTKLVRGAELYAAVYSNTRDKVHMHEHTHA